MAGKNVKSESAAKKLVKKAKKASPQKNNVRSKVVLDKGGKAKNSKAHDRRVLRSSQGSNDDVTSPSSTQVVHASGSRSTDPVKPKRKRVPNY